MTTKQAFDAVIAAQHKLLECKANVVAHRRTGNLDKALRAYCVAWTALERAESNYIEIASRER